MSDWLDDGDGSDHSETLAMCLEWRRALEAEVPSPSSSSVRDISPGSPRPSARAVSSSSPAPGSPRPPRSPPQSNHAQPRSAPRNDSPRRFRPTASDIQQEVQLRQAELEAEIEPQKEENVRVQVSPTSWLRIPARAAREHADLSCLVRETRELAQQRAVDAVEQHRSNVVLYPSERRGKESLAYLLQNSQCTWREPTSSLAQEALRSLLHSQHSTVVIELFEAFLRKEHKGNDAGHVRRGAIRMLVLLAVPSPSGQHDTAIALRAHKALTSTSLASPTCAALIAEQLTRLHLDTGHAHYVLLLQELTEETAERPETANHFLAALEQTHQTYSDECTDGTAENFLDYHDLQVSLCNASLAYIMGQSPTAP